MSITITIDTKEIERPNIEYDYIKTRRALYDSCGFFENELVIVVVAYNRLEKTKQCVESILRHTEPKEYVLVLVDNGSHDENLNYFESVKHEKTIVYHITNNIGAMYGFLCAYRNLDSKFIAFVPNDVVVTHNWMNNLLSCIKSDTCIGMVTPSSSNVSNEQQISIGEFTNIDEMQDLAAKYNISNPMLWEERPRLLPVVALFRTEMLHQIGYHFDLGFYHDFAEDELARRIHRNGWKMILCKDTYVEHDHSYTDRINSNLHDSLEIGRQDFKSKFRGIDAWDDFNNYISYYIDNMTFNKSYIEKVNILGIDIKCGTPFFDVRNRIRKDGIKDSVLYAFTTDIKYFTDLSSFPAEITHGNPDDVIYKYDAESMDIVICGTEINAFPYTKSMILDFWKLVKKDGYFLFCFRNMQDYMHYLQIMEIITGDDVYEGWSYADCKLLLDKIAPK